MDDAQTSTSSSLHALLWCLATAFACAAHADCGPVIAAYGKADATKRFAIYEVDSITEVPKGEPFSVALGDVAYVQQYVRKGPLQVVKDGYKKGGHAAGFEADSLRSREKKGEVRCEPLGERKIGTEPAMGYQIRNNDKGSQTDYAAIHIWTSRATGLPLFHGMGSDGGGFRWVYGTDVVAPDPAKIKK
jgi:hypothetical protein